MTSLGGNPGSREPDPSSTGSGPPGFDPGRVDYSGMEPRHNPREPIFRDHNCWKCREGEVPCAEGNYNNCSYPHARND